MRTRTKTFAAAWRFRDAIVGHIHDFFRVGVWSRFKWLPHDMSLIFALILQSNDFVHIHTPLITSQDCEGGGEVFRVSVPKATPSQPNNNDAQSAKPDEFFGEPAYLTVSGQLHLELASCGSMPRVYTLGPTFRAEPAHTTRHLAEFWMLEAEVSFMQELEQLCSLVEALIKSVSTDVLNKNTDDLAYFSALAAREDPQLQGQKDWLLQRLALLSNSSGQFLRMTYSDAVETLLASGRDFKYPVEWGKALQTEHERYLAEQVAKGPVFVTDYPIVVKPFYMRVNGDAVVDGATERDLVASRVTVACTDLLVPRVGELVGGSMREDKAAILLARMKDSGLTEGGQYDWYADLRRFGSVPHGGFGMGLERLLMYLSGIQNARDVTLVPRYVGACKY